MHIFLYGPSGSGKTTIGKLLAQALDIPFLDLDDEIEKVTGQPIAKYLGENGEVAFRNVEAGVLGKSVGGLDKVVILGGGALLRDENRSLVLASGEVVFLDADQAVLAKRLAQDKNKRPLLEGALEQNLKTLLKDREIHYSAFPMRVDASQPPDQVVWDIQRKLGRFHLSGMGSGYDVLVRIGGLGDLGNLLQSRKIGELVMVVSDSNVAPLYSDRVLVSLGRAGFSPTSLVIPAGEMHKKLDAISSLWNGCLEGGLDRKSTLIAIGGGVVGDLTGFAAATFMRGIDWVSLPTSLLAMVDASIGGKTGFDLPEGKNLIGAFHPPRLVLADPQVLNTLPARELIAGLAEVVKHGLIADPELFSQCALGLDAVSGNLQEIVRRAIAVKVKIAENDPFEQGFRATLNFGHTVGHALELASGFSILHGEAVSIGMVAETRLAERISIAETGLSNVLASTLSALGLPVEIPGNLNHETLIKAMQADKKKSKGIVRFTLPVKIGEVKTGVVIDKLKSVFEEEE